MLEGKEILITGASRGIGRACALLLAKNGARVIVNYHENESAAQEVVNKIEKDGGSAIAIKADVSNPDQVKEMFTKIKEEFGKLDVLINNAGILKDSLLMLTKLEDVEKQIRVNQIGTLLCMQHASKMMMKNNGGKIINLSSIIGRYGNAGQIPYAATKSAVIGMTTSAAKELGRYNITVNAVAPGIIDTDMVSHLPEKVKEELTHKAALNRMGTPQDVANVILFLSSNLSDYVSGQVIGVDGCQVI